MTYKQITRTEARQAINRVANSEDGQIFLAVLCKQCGFMSNLMSMEDPNITQVLAAQRGVYGAIRNQIRPENLLQAEYRIQIVDDPPEKVDKK